MYRGENSQMVKKRTAAFGLFVLLLIASVYVDSGVRHLRETVEAKGTESEEISESENVIHEPKEMVWEDLCEDSNDEPMSDSTEKEPEPWVFINPEGMTLLTRFNTPEGYFRTEALENSFAEFVLNYPLKEDGAQVFLYNRTPSPYQICNMAVFDLPIENVDLQQCADSVMRFYAEYYWNQGCADQLSFYYTTGFVSDYASWREGYRVQYAENQFSWVASAGYEDSYSRFVAFLRHAFTFAGTRSMDYYEAYTITMDEVEIGDVFLEGGSPGHVVMVVDICYDEQGRKAFLLADGHTPAQDFHVMKNALHEDNPWYYEEEIVYPFETYAHIYSENSLQRVTYDRYLNAE